MTATSPKRIRSARGQSSNPPASTGKIISPGENHHSDRCTAATPMASVAMVRTKAIRRFRVMNWRRIWPVTRAATERASRAERVRGRETMMGELYPHPQRSGTLPN